jgi:hypothetical protein
VFVIAMAICEVLSPQLVYRPEAVKALGLALRRAPADHDGVLRGCGRNETLAYRRFRHATATHRIALTRPAPRHTRTSYFRWTVSR